jgi:arabinofuranosyltransferase
MCVKPRVPEETTGTRLEILFRRFAVLYRPIPLLLLACVPSLVILLFSHIRSMDDSYIYHRYAHNFVTGQGLVFNPGEKVEGFTSLLWQLMMLVPASLGLPPHVFAAFLGVAFGLLALIYTWHTCRRLGISLWGTFTAVVMLGLYPDFWRALTNGLEGGLFAFVLVLVAYLIFSGRLLSAGVWGGLLFMVRPDSILIAPVCALYLLRGSTNQSLSLRKRFAHPLLTLLAPWLVLVVGVTLWRLAYYGAWIPNSITAKSMPLSVMNFGMVKANILDGLHYWLGFLVSAAPLVLSALLALIMETWRPAVWLCLGIVATSIPTVLANGGDWMPNYRLLVIYAPLLAVLLGITADRIAAIRYSSRIPFPQPVILFVIVLLLLAGISVVLQSTKWDVTPDFVGWQDIQWDATPDLVVEKADPCHQELADRVRPALLPTDRVSPEVLGIFSYMLPNIYSHDFLGLTDSYVARYGTDYISKAGKIAPTYTYYTIQPNLILGHRGLDRLSRIARDSHGTYNENYRTYSLTKPPPHCVPGTQGVVISIRQDSAERIFPVFAELGPQPVIVPNEPEE